MLRQVSRVLIRTFPIWTFFIFVALNLSLIQCVKFESLNVIGAVLNASCVTPVLTLVKLQCILYSEYFDLGVEFIKYQRSTVHVRTVHLKRNTYFLLLTCLDPQNLWDNKWRGGVHLCSVPGLRAAEEALTTQRSLWRHIELRHEQVAGLLSHLTEVAAVIGSLWELSAHAREKWPSIAVNRHLFLSIIMVGKKYIDFQTAAVKMITSLIRLKRSRKEANFD